MKDHPVLFQGWKVRKILEWNFDTQGDMHTRRVMKPQPEYKENSAVPDSYGTFFHGWNLDHPNVGINDISKYCPYGKPGDRLWVRETHTMHVKDCQCIECRTPAEERNRMMVVHDEVTGFTLQHFADLLRRAVCPECDGSGSIPVQVRCAEFATKEMAVDAGEPGMEGMQLCDDEWEQQQCQWCHERDEAVKLLEKA